MCVKLKGCGIMVLGLLMITSQVTGTRPMLHSAEMEVSEIRNGQHYYEPVDTSDEPVSGDMQAELRVSSLASEVIQLLEEEEARPQQLNHSSKHPSLIEPQKMDCSKITMQIFQVLLQNPDTVEPEDYSCGLLNLISQFEKYNVRIRSLEASLHTAAATIKALESTFQAEMAKSQFLVKELNETVSKETERAIKAENVIARRVLSEKTRVDTIQKNLTEFIHSALEQVKEFEVILNTLEEELPSKSSVSKESMSMNPLLSGLISPLHATSPKENGSSKEDLQKIEHKLSSMQEFIQELSNRIANMEDGSDEHVNKGITQIFKTYASLANEIEKETERASGEETNLKTLITNEVAGLAKQIQNLQDRIADEKNRVQIIENRRTADLFEEINRAKSEEVRLAQKLKDEMSKAAAAFKRLEVHVDTQLNFTKPLEDDFKTFADNVTRRAVEVEEKCTEQITFERTRAQSVENSLKSHLETEVTRAMSVENELKRVTAEERERARNAEHELKVAIDVETYRAKGVEMSLSAQATSDGERAKKDKWELHESISANSSRLMSDILKEFTRAQTMEKELNDKILNEVSRAMNAEQGVLSSLNTETSRAQEKEKELYRLLQSQENSVKSLDTIKSQVETESHRAREAEQNLETKLHAEVSRARNAEENIVSGLQDELSRFRAVEANLTQRSSEVVRHTKELELEVRKTVMAEVARAVDAENSLKQQIYSEMNRALQAEMTLSQYQLANNTHMSMRLHEFTREVEKDSLRLEDISLQISRNLTGDILTLAELFDDKLDDLERSENVRLKRLEEDLKKCCSSSSWRWRSPKSNGGRDSSGVLARIIQAFGGIVDDEDQKNSSTTKRKSGEEEDRSIKSGSDKNRVNSEPSVDKDEPTQTTVSKTDATPHRNVTFVFANPEKGDEQERMSEKTRRKKLTRKQSGQNISEKENMKPYSMQNAHSRVTRTFG